MFKIKSDNTEPVISAVQHIESCRKWSSNKNDFPKTAVLFFMHGGVEYLLENYDCKLLTDKFPRFLNSCPVYKVKDYDFCFLSGGHAAPQAVDTLETLKALGTEKVITVGMYGAFSNLVDCGDIVIPSKAFVEESTSLHYYDSIEYSTPDKNLHKQALEYFKANNYSIVSTDSVYRQTFLKEQEWRDKGAVGVDMETSALFSVGKYLGIDVVSILIASDKHPKSPNEQKWHWNMPKEKRISFFNKCIDFVKSICTDSNNLELWDAYDRDMNKIDDMVLVRGRPIPNGIYHLVCDIAVKHTDGTYLLMQRDLQKHLGGMWELSAGGSALQGETPLECAARELAEETGIISDNLNKLGVVINDNHNTIYFEYICITDCNKKSIVLQEGETIDYKWVDFEYLKSLKRDKLATTRIQSLMEELNN